MAHATDTEAWVDHPLPPPTPEMVMMTDEMMDALRPDSYQDIPGFDALFMRDLAHIAELTGGRYGAATVKGNPDAPWLGSPWHYHHLELQLVFILKGWANFEFEGIGTTRFSEGTVIYQPPMNRHREMEMSTDFEALLLTIPARFPSTTMIADASGSYEELYLDMGDPEAYELANLQVQDDPDATVETALA